MPCTLAVFPREPADTRASAQSRPVYRPRKPEASPLWQLVTNHAHTFLDLYDDRYAPRYGPLRAVVPRALESFQRCGLLAHGFARVRCPDCRHEYLLAFSCKQRCLCPSCHAKRQAAFGEFVTEEILEPVPHRHVVISLPRRLRPFLRRRKRLTPGWPAWPTKRSRSCCRPLRAHGRQSPVPWRASRARGASSIGIPTCIF